MADRTPQHIIDEIKRLYEEGKGRRIIVREILKTHGFLISETTVRDYVARLGLQKPKTIPPIVPKWGSGFAGNGGKGWVNGGDNFFKYTSVPPETVKESQGAQPRARVVLVIPDLHCPFQHPHAALFLQAVKEKYQPDDVVCLGDEVDFHSFSRYIPDPEGYSPHHELRRSIYELQPFYRLFPDMKVCESNHTVRPLKKGFVAGLPSSFLPSYATMLDAPDGWQWASSWEIDGVRYIHGDNGKSGMYAHQNYMRAFKQSVVIGHMHAHAGVQYESELFALNAGCLIDRDAYAFKYARNMATQVNLGCGLIIGGKEAHFIPMHTDAAGAWTGQLSL